MKVLVISGTFPPMKSGGAEYAFRLCQQLADSKQEISVLTSAIPHVATDPRFDTFPIMHRWTWMGLPRLMRIVARCRPDVLNIHFVGSVYGNHPMITIVPSIMKRRYPGMLIVTHIEYPSGVNLALVPFWTRVVRKVVIILIGTKDVDWEYGTLLRDSTRLIALSDQHRKVLGSHCPAVENKCHVIPPPPLMRISEEANGLSRCHGRALLKATSGDFVIAYYGLLYPGKGIETLLESMVLLKAEHKRICLVLIGGPNEVTLREMNRPHYFTELKNRTEQLGIADRVTFTGYYKSESNEASLYLRGADACVLPFDDGVRLHRSSVAASAAHGLPIITTKGNSIEPAFVDKANVLLCPPKDPKSLATAICILISDSGLQERLRRGSLQLVRELFSMENVLQRTIEVFGNG